MTQEENIRECLERLGLTGQHWAYAAVEKAVRQAARSELEQWQKDNPPFRGWSSEELELLRRREQFDPTAISPRELWEHLSKRCTCGGKQFRYRNGYWRCVKCDALYTDDWAEVTQ